MSVEAARNLLRSSEQPTPGAVYFATATPPYLDKTNANAIHAALNLPSEVFAGDLTGSARSTTAAVRAALHDSRPVLVTSSDVRTGRPSSADEANLGDAGAAVMIADGDEAPILAEWLGGGSATGEFLDRWRLPGWEYSRVWEERFGEAAYGPLVTEAATDALKQTGAVRRRHRSHGRDRIARAGRPPRRRVDRARRHPWRRRPVGHDRQHRQRARSGDARQRARSGIARSDDHAGQSRRRLRHRRVPHHRRDRRVLAVCLGRVADRGRQRRACLQHIPHVARLPRPGTAAAPRSRTARRASLAVATPSSSTASWGRATGRPGRSTCRRSACR